MGLRSIYSVKMRRHRIIWIAALLVAFVFAPSGLAQSLWYCVDGQFCGVGLSCCCGQPQPETPVSCGDVCPPDAAASIPLDRGVPCADGCGCEQVVTSGSQTFALRTTAVTPASSAALLPTVASLPKAPHTEFTVRTEAPTNTQRGFRLQSAARGPPLS